MNIRVHYLNGSVLYMNLRMDEIIRVRLCLTKHQRHRVAREVIAGPGYKCMSFVLWIKITVSLRLNKGEVLTPLLASEGKGGISPYDSCLYG